MTDGRSAGPTSHSCGVCADAATSVRVLSVSRRAAEVIDEGGCRLEVAVDFVPDVRPGDRLLVHAGVAIARQGRPRERSGMGDGA